MATSVTMTSDRKTDQGSYRQRPAAEHRPSPVSVSVRVQVRSIWGHYDVMGKINTHTRTRTHTRGDALSGDTQKQPLTHFMKSPRRQTERLCEDQLV